jgi:hypothetical protein
MEDSHGSAYQALSKASMADDRRSSIWFSMVGSHARASKSVTVAEVGVGQGGRLALSGLAIQQAGAQGHIIGFDTFDNPFCFSTQDERDSDFNRKLKSEQKLMSDKFGFEPSRQVWMESVENLVRESKYTGSLTLVAGKAERTIPEFIENTPLPSLALDFLSVSCNWYAPVKAALCGLFTLVRPGGVVFLDGYYFWEAFRGAADEVLGDFSLIGASCREGDCRILTKRPAP